MPASHRIRTHVLAWFACSRGQSATTYTTVAKTKQYVFFTHMVFESELTVKLHAKDIEVGTSSDRNPRQDQVTMGRVDSNGSTIH